MSDFKDRSAQLSVKSQTAGLEGKYLTFCLEKEEYGVSILKVREIIGMMPIRTIPGTPDFVKGVINLRGKVIPVIDLRLKFGMEEAGHTEKTSIIVADVETSAKVILHIGIVVDFVSEVVNIKIDEIEAAPSFGCDFNAGHILGLAKLGKGVKILLDIDKILTFENLGGLTLEGGEALKSSVAA